MDILRGILDRIVLIGAILAAGCVPSFIGQYQQRLGGMLDQANRDLALFQDIANRLHGGDIQRLIKHHLASTDPTFRAEGTAIQTMLETVARLKATSRRSTPTSSARSGGSRRTAMRRWPRRRGMPSCPR